MFSLPQLVSRNLRYHWRGNIAVLLGVGVGAAVLTGALLVGDSLRGSLRDRAERQLGGVETAAIFPRPIPAGSADGMPGHTAPVLLLQGSLQKIVAGDESNAPFLGRVTVLGVDERFKPAGIATDVNWSSSVKGKKDDAGVVLSHRVAAKLGVARGDRVRLGVPRFSDLPRSS